MKRLMISLAILFLSVTLLNNCKEKEEEPPELPPQESMALNFSINTKNAKSAEIETDTSKAIFGVSAITVGYWNLVLGVTLAIPVASFYKSFENEPAYLGNKSWQWSYTVTVLAANYNARMVGTIRQDDVKWEMYISKSGVGAFNEFLWFEGTSALDGKSGKWILYQSPTENETVVQIDWSKSNNVVGNIKYTYTRISDNGDANQLSANSYLNYGLTDSNYNAFYNIHYNTRNRDAEAFLDVNIEWSTTLYNGRIKAVHYFTDSDWHCWDSQGYDVVCP